MENFEPKTVLIVVTLMVCLAIVLDFLRRRKRNRYDNIQMSSREIERTSRGESEDDPFAQSQFPSGRARVKVRDEADTYSSLSKQPEQGALSLNTEADSVEASNKQSQLSQQQDQQNNTNNASTNSSEPEDVLVMHLMTDKGQTFAVANCCLIRRFH